MIQINNEKIINAINKRLKTQTKREVSVALGVWDRTLDKVLSGDQTVNVQTLGKIASRLGFQTVISFTNSNGN